MPSFFGKTDVQYRGWQWNDYDCPWWSLLEAYNDSNSNASLASLYELSKKLDEMDLDEFHYNFTTTVDEETIQKELVKSDCEIVKDFIKRQQRLKALPGALKDVFYWSQPKAGPWKTTDTVKNVAWVILTGLFKLLEAVPLCLELALEHFANWVKHGILTVGKGEKWAVALSLVVVGLLRLPMYVLSFARQCLIRPITSPVTSFQRAKERGGVTGTVLAFMSATYSLAAWAAILCYALPLAVHAAYVLCAGQAMPELTSLAFLSTAYAHLPVMSVMPNAVPAMAGLATTAAGSCGTLTGVAYGATHCSTLFGRRGGDTGQVTKVDDHDHDDGGFSCVGI